MHDSITAKVEVASAVASGRWSYRGATRGTPCDLVDRLAFRGFTSSSGSILGVAWAFISSDCFFTIDVFVVVLETFVEVDDERLDLSLVG